MFSELKQNKKNITIDFIDFKLNLGNNNPSNTAIFYGLINIIIPTIICFFNEIIPIQNYNIKITPNFKTNKVNILFYCKINTNFIFMIFRYFVIKRRLKNVKYKSSSH
ncbi:DUF2953 domain-containing protein [Defluviitalea phaphyphila]|uniref:DUF2953 domain-containing protein n=1 Tax=Defluviitalea phaphyphila TaxID=1473580 RepID=UPI0038BC564B